MTRDLKFIPLPPGSPKLLLPMGFSAVQARGLELYAPGSIKGKILKGMASTVSHLGLLGALGSLISKDAGNFELPASIRPILIGDQLSGLLEQWSEILHAQNIVPAISLGTPNDFQKITALLCNEKGRPLAIAKIGATEASRRLLLNESRALTTMEDLGLQTLRSPELIGSCFQGDINWLLQEALFEGSPSPLKPEKIHLKALAELFIKTRETGRLGEVSFWSRMTDGIERLGPAELIRQGLDSDFLKEFKTSLAKGEDSDSGPDWPLGSAHGDFTPWNMRLGSLHLGVFDWEYFTPKAPLGWDLMRYLVMVDHLIEGRSRVAVYRDIASGRRHARSFDHLEDLCGQSIPDRSLLAALAILDLSVEAVRGQATAD